MQARKITLVRHGPPTVSLTEWVSGRSLCHFIERYNQAGLIKGATPPSASRKAIAGVNHVFVSDYRRTMASATQLNLSAQTIDSVFREVDCWVNFPWPFPTPAWIWLLLTRILWPLSLTQAPESFAQAQRRAYQVATTLIESTQNHPHVVLVGHGGMNTLISRELRILGWKGPKQPRLSHWAATTYLAPADMPPKMEEV